MIDLETPSSPTANPLSRIAFSSGKKSPNCRRRYRRYSFFESALITGESGEPTIAFTRDISRVGFGLIHNVPLPAQKAKMHLCKRDIELQVDISLTTSNTKGWYTSFCRFERISALDAKRLFIGTAVRRLDPRQMFRHPYFTPVELETNDSQDKDISIFTRDISLSGIGLFHNQPLSECKVRIHAQNVETPLSANVKWCQSCGHGWYISGAEFDRESEQSLFDLFR